MRQFLCGGLHKLEFTEDAFPNAAKVLEARGIGIDDIGETAKGIDQIFRKRLYISPWDGAEENKL